MKEITLRVTRAVVVTREYGQDQTFLSLHPTQKYVIINYGGDHKYQMLVSSLREASALREALTAWSERCLKYMHTQKDMYAARRRTVDVLRYPCPISKVGAKRLGRKRR
jgi:hypothetical protein